MRVALTSGAYQARSVISGALRCVNLYPESNPDDSQAPVPVTHFPTPGFVTWAQLPDYAVVRCLYTASTGDLYACSGQSIYYIPVTGVPVKLGSISSGVTPVSMVDNGQTLMIVDGTSNGYVIDLTVSGRTFGKINDPVFTGGVRAEYLDTFFIVSVPGTRIFQLSLSQPSFAMMTSFTSGAAWNPLWIVAKSGGADNVASIICVHRELWVVGTLSTEIWVDEGTPDIPIGALPGAFIDHGCVAPYSLAKSDASIYWLSQDKNGRGIVMRGYQYQAFRISTHALEDFIQGYAVIIDAIGMVYQIAGHEFYVLTFPTQNITWGFEIATGQWHQWAFLNPEGGLSRHRANCMTSAYGENLLGDWQNGSIYKLSSEFATDNGNPIPRIRTFPHMIDDGEAIVYRSFILDIQPGNITESQMQIPGDFNPDFSHDFGLLSRLPVQVSLRWSDTRGASWSNPVVQEMGETGEFLTSVKWSRLGRARDRVFEVSWSAPILTALNGAFIESTPAGA